MDKSAYAYTLDFKVRDYECDLQGVVNNGVYQNYLEHTRHEFFLSEGIDFADLCRRNIHLVVVRAELDFMASLVSGDSFWVGTTIQPSSKIRFEFLQDIYRATDNKKMLAARIVCTGLNERGRPYLPDEVRQLLDRFSRSND
ncbi:MAG: acyl-CoA thioesterase [Gammaproteobacteria bacterium]|nr:acyl-CoA thioesterase [Gammaproteobacteria bacterium]MDH5694367.1 acyl-CoA thioesterase [Gammaproteobacteria bacterium]